MYEERFYRHPPEKSFSIEVTYYESDLYITSRNSIKKDYVRKVLIRYYSEIQDYIKMNPEFLSSLSSLPADDTAPPIVKDMLRSSLASGIGPFSSVAGAIACYVGKDLLNVSEDVIVENGGDIFLKINEDKNIGIYLGENFSPHFIFVKVKKRDYPFGICSSSSKIGHSLNFGNADLLTVFAKDTILADSLATAFSNRLKKKDDIDKIFNEAKNNFLVEAVIVAFSNELFLWGDVEFSNP